MAPSDEAWQPVGSFLSWLERCRRAGTQGMLGFLAVLGRVESSVGRSRAGLVRPLARSRLSSRCPSNWGTRPTDRRTDPGPTRTARGDALV